MIEIEEKLLVSLIALARSALSEMWHPETIEQAEKDIAAAKLALETKQAAREWAKAKIAKWEKDNEHK